MANEGIELWIYDVTDPTERKAVLPFRTEPTTLRELKAVGGGSFNIPVNAPQLDEDPTLIQSENICKFVIDNHVFNAFVIKSRKAVTIGEGEAAEEAYLVTGEGLKTWFKQATIKPWGGLKKNSKDSRAFSFASPVGEWYDEDDWVTPDKYNKWSMHTHSLWGYYPDKWPDIASGAWWVWNDWATRWHSPAGFVYFRLELPNMDAGKYSLVLAVEDQATIYVDGQEVAQGQGFEETKKVDFELTAGDHIIGIKAYTDGGRSGLLAALLGHTLELPPVTVGTATISIASPATVTRTAHNLQNGDKVFFTTSGTLPNGIEADRTYYVRDRTANTFRVATSPGGGAITTTGSQSGTHTIHYGGVESQPFLITYTGMTSDEMDEVYAEAVNFANNQLAYYNGLPAGNASGNNTQKQQAAKKKEALASYQRAVQRRDQASAERAAAYAAEAQGIEWKMNAYPETDPGWSVGEILLLLLDEAEDRGIRFPTLLTPTFTATEDSNGNPWPDARDWTFSVGEKYSSVISKFEELDCEVWIDPDTYELNVVGGLNNRGVDRTEFTYDVDGVTVLSTPVEFKKGKNLRKASMQSQSKIVNSLDVKLPNGWVTTPYQDDESIAKYGVIEDTLSLDSTQGMASTLASIIFSQRAGEEEGASYDIYATDKIPGVDFNEGDWVLAPNERGLQVPRRVVSISVEEGPNGRPLYTIEFDTIFRDNEQRLNEIVTKLGGGGVGASSSNASGGTIDMGDSQPVVIPPTPPVILQIPRRPEGVEVFSIGSWSASGVNALSTAIVTWEPVTLNTDGTDTVPAFYQVWAYKTDVGAQSEQMFAQSVDPYAEIPGFTPTEEWAFVVYAFHNVNFRSEGSEPFIHELEGPTTPMDAPDDPTIISSKGLVVIQWNGLLQGNDPPPQFRYTYAEVAAEASPGVPGPFAAMGAALDRDGRDIVLAGLTIGDTYYARLRSVDGAGIATAASNTVSIVVTGIELEDLDGSIQDTIDAAYEAAIRARQAVNLLEDPSFEQNNLEFWALGANTANVTTEPRTGERHLLLNSDTTVYARVVYQRTLECDPGDNFLFRFYAKPASGNPVDAVDEAISIMVLYGASEDALVSGAIITASGEMSGDYDQIETAWEAPAGAHFFKPVLVLNDTTIGHSYFVDDIRVLRMAGQSLIVDGGVTADKIAAGEVLAIHIAAEQILTEHLGVGQVTFDNMAGNSIDSNNIRSNAIQTNHVDAGAITVTHLAPSVGDTINIAGNVSIQSVEALVDNVAGNLDTTNGTIAEMRTYYEFGPTGAVISTPGSPFATAIRNDRIEMLENGNVISYWNSGKMVVNQLEVSTIILGNHQIEKITGGTIVKAVS